MYFALHSINECYNDFLCYSVAAVIYISTSFSHNTKQYISPKDTVKNNFTLHNVHMELTRKYLKNKKECRDLFKAINISINSTMEII